MRVAVLVMWPATNSSPTSRRGSHRRSRDRRPFSLPAAGSPVVPRRSPPRSRRPGRPRGRRRSRSHPYGRAVRVRPFAAAVTGGARQRLRVIALDVVPSRTWIRRQGWSSVFPCGDRSSTGSQRDHQFPDPAGMSREPVAGVSRGRRPARTGGAGPRSPATDGTQVDQVSAPFRHAGRGRLASWPGKHAKAASPARGSSPVEPGRCAAPRPSSRHPSSPPRPSVVTDAVSAASHARASEPSRSRA
jgi:hypothetical protein